MERGVGEWREGTVSGRGEGEEGEGCGGRGRLRGGERGERKIMDF